MRKSSSAGVTCLRAPSGRDWQAVSVQRKAGLGFQPKAAGSPTFHSDHLPCTLAMPRQVALNSSCTDSYDKNTDLRHSVG